MSSWWTASYYDQGDAYPSYRYASDEELQAARGSPGQVLIDAAKNKRPCAQPHGHDESDLCAQWRAAKAAERAALWGLVQMVLSGFGVVGLAVTLWYNRHALRIAQDANSETRRIGEAQTRCYLYIKEATIRVSKYGFTLASIKVVNSGQSPAINLRWGYDARYTVLRPELIHKVSVPPIGAVWSEDVAVGKPYKSAQYKAGPSLSPENRTLLSNGIGIAIGCSITMIWEDVFGNEFEETHDFTALSVVECSEHVFTLRRDVGAVKRRKPDKSGDL